ncbi:NUDIX hydrolase [Celeribacter sp. HF31]|uniref:NUDIX hydrolase n=1 Tax=Celeribacter sp. HF31 TaxID=2721558 RepID=UPI001430729C|nr:NUDIX hydrolase [Celeribacter sp. HF31]NIY80773.1 NUDIX hydrolase [Celeribacter sp. HF31]
MMTNVPIRDAATVVLLRDGAEGPRVLMGQRGRSAVFMPGKFVFPGGAVDAEDFAAPVVLDPQTLRRLSAEASPELASALVTAAVRELREETGLLLKETREAEFIFRAITPPGRPRRFDARFFLIKAEDIANDPDDFSRAEDELSLLQWVTLEGARAFDLPFVTRVVLAEVEAALHKDMPPDHVPFFDHREAVGKIRALI